MRIKIISVGHSKRRSPYRDLFDDYAKRLNWSLDDHEIDARKFADSASQAEKIIESLPDTGAYVFALDERGKTLSSPDIADKLQQLQLQNFSPAVFIIGGADGLDKKVRERADYLMSFGKQTWPHQMVRVMLLEQIYRAQQILSGHPYHRE